MLRYLNQCMFAFQIKNIIYHAVKDALALLQSCDPEDSKTWNVMNYVSQPEKNNEYEKVILSTKVPFSRHCFEKVFLPRRMRLMKFFNVL